MRRPRMQTGTGTWMGLMTEQGGASDEYEAVALPPGPQMAASSLGSAVFLRRSARPSRRAVLHLHDLTRSFAPADLARWYNERGFHFYVTDLDSSETLAATSRRQPADSLGSSFAAIDSACRYLREAGGIDAVILSAQESTALPAMLWCDARRASRPVAALILSKPDFGRARMRRLNIPCPVLVISAAGQNLERQKRSVSLGQHVTWLHLEDLAANRHPARQGAPDGAGSARRRLFDEMGRWLGAYMYGGI